MATLAPAYRPRRPQTGAVTFVQRFGSSLNLNVHFHVVVLDGVYTRDSAGRAVFHPAPPPTAAELEGVVERVRVRAGRWLARHSPPAAARETGTPTPLEACAAIAMKRGSVQALRTDGDDPDAGAGSPPLEPPARERGAVERDGWNLHASVAIDADDDLGRERLCRYGARPAMALDRLRRVPDGRFAYRVKQLRDGRAKHRVMTALELLARLAALVPPPRYPLVRYHGVLAPRSSWRRDVVPRAPVPGPFPARFPLPLPVPARAQAPCERTTRQSPDARSGPSPAGSTPSPTDARGRQQTAEPRPVPAPLSAATSVARPAPEGPRGPGAAPCLEHTVLAPGILRAARDFRHVAELNPRNIDAAREVRLQQMRGGVPGPSAKHDSSPPPPPSNEGKPGLLNRLFKKP